MALIFFIIAAVLFVLAAFAVSVPRVHLGWLGAAFLAVALAVGAV
jgi:hypothetical protein